MRHCFKLYAMSAFLCVLTSCSHDSRNDEVPTFSGSSDQLKRTVIVETLETTIPPGKSAIWNASFQVVWKGLQDLAGEPVSLDDDSGFSKRMNAADSLLAAVPQDSVYSISGIVGPELLNRVRNDLNQKMPGVAPDLSGLAPGDFFSYGCLSVELQFPLPYSQIRVPLGFTDASGGKTEVRAFGMLAEDVANYKYYMKLREQSRLLFHSGEARDGSLEFAVDLCATSAPSQIVISRIVREGTLRAAFARVESEIVKTADYLKTLDTDEANHWQKLEPGDRLSVPDLCWFVSHRFSEIEGKRFGSGKLKGQKLVLARQDTLFRLNRKGARLKSSSSTDATTAVPTDYFLDRPFLIYMKKRGAALPYFAMWVDNAELLTAWDKPKTDRD